MTDTQTTPPAPWATTQTQATADTQPVAQPHDDPALPASAPALNPPTWSGRKTAIAAALAIGFSSVGALGAAAAVPAGSFQGDQTGGQRGFTPGGPGSPGRFGGPGGPGGQGGPGGPGGRLQQSPNGIQQNANGNPQQPPATS